MKTIILLSLVGLFSPQLQAGDLIFRSGFEASHLVKGTATGIVATGLTLDLEVNGMVVSQVIDTNGQFVFDLDVAVGETWSVEIISLPDNPQQQSCTLINPTGIMPTTGTDTLQVQCNNNAWNWDEMNWNEGGWN